MRVGQSHVGGGGGGVGRFMMEGRFHLRGRGLQKRVLRMVGDFQNFKLKWPGIKEFPQNKGLVLFQMILLLYLNHKSLLMVVM